MARLDLKYCDIYLTDGERHTAAINQVGGETAGSTVLDYDTFSAIVPSTATLIPVGSLIQIGTSKKPYRVTASTTTTVTISPPLLTAVADNSVITVIGKYGRLKIGDGNLTFDINTPHEYLKDRGKIDEVRLADEEPLDVNASGIIEFFKSDAADPNGTFPSFTEILTQTGAASSWHSSDSDSCRPYSLNILVDYSPQCTTQRGELTTFPVFRKDKMSGDLKGSTLNLTGKCNVQTPTFDRYLQA